jgi:SNF2 family DNA or RNA helicase
MLPISPLWPHQEAALEFADGRPSVMLAMAMRTGKSRVTVEALASRQVRKALIICPKSAIPVWPKQFELYGELPVYGLEEKSMVARTQAATDFYRRNRGRGAVVINHDAIWRAPFKQWALAQEWDALICDESHRLKAPGGVSSRFVALLGHKIPHKLALTGTPMPHSPLDIYAQYRILDPSIYGTSYARFRYRYAIYKPMQNFELLTGWQNQDELMAKMYAIAFRVGPEVLNLPEPLHMTRACRLAPAAQRAYQELEREFYTQVAQGEITAANVMVKGLRLQQLTSGFGRLADSGDEVQLDDSKEKLLADLLEDLDEPVAVFCRFTHDLAAVHRVAAKLGRTSLELSGKRNELLVWQEGGAQVLAVQTQAGGAGIDLSRAKVAIYYSLGLSLGDHEQSMARFQALGQTYHIAYYYLLAENSIDGKVFQALRDRRDVIQALLTKHTNNDRVACIA